MGEPSNETLLVHAHFGGSDRARNATVALPLQSHRGQREIPRTELVFVNRRALIRTLSAGAGAAMNRAWFVGASVVMVMAFGCSPGNDGDGGPQEPDGVTGKGDDVDTLGDPSAGAVHPIVLVHAFHADTTNSWSLVRVKEALEIDGHFVVLAGVPRYAGTPERAAALASELDEARAEFCDLRMSQIDPETCFETAKVHIVGHSQGGLDARFVVSRLDYGEHTASVTTIGAPHRGTPLGDIGLSLVLDPRRKRESDRLFVAALDQLLSHLLAAVRPEGLADAFYWLSEARFQNAVPGAEEAMPDIAGVVYQSWAGVATSSGTLPDVGACCPGLVETESCLDLSFPNGRAGEFHGLQDAKTFEVVNGAFDHAHQPNDGHIPVASAVHGQFRGCVPADHLDLIGRPDDQADDNADSTGFDYLAFYRSLGQTLVEIENAAG